MPSTPSAGDTDVEDSHPRVAVIGAGFSGIAAAVALQRRGISNVVVFESAPAIGGTWWYNRYPGAEVDLESHIYSYSFEHHDWSRSHAKWDEIRRYLEHVADKWGISARTHFCESVTEVRWIETQNVYRVKTTSDRNHGDFDFVVSAVGFLNSPVLPSFAKPGTSNFRGTVCHTSRWPEGLELAGLRVGVVGTGSSAVQVVAEAAKVAAEVKIFQRSPNWILPKGGRVLSPSERRFLRIPAVYRWRRLRLFLGYDLRQWRSSHAKSSGYVNRRRHQAAQRYLQESLSASPGLMAAVTPDFPFEGKRTVISDDYYHALIQPNVSLVPFGISDLVEEGPVDDDGTLHELEALIMATGFDASNYLGSFDVIGRQDRDLHAEWGVDPEAFLGLMVPSFPNFFMMYGPNTNAVPLVSFYEAQARFIAATVDRASQNGFVVAEVRPRAFDWYHRWLRRRLAKTVWSGTRSYFQSPSGKVVSQWPFGASTYLIACRIAARGAVRLER